MPPWGSEGNGDERILGSTFREKPSKTKMMDGVKHPPVFFLQFQFNYLVFFVCVCGSKLLSDYDFALLRNIISPEPGCRSTNDE